jgi:hypothetical protein
MQLLLGFAGIWAQVVPALVCVPHSLGVHSCSKYPLTATPYVGLASMHAVRHANAICAISPQLR